DPIWWLFVLWIPIYLSEVYGMDVKTIGIYGWVPYVGAMLGAWFGGLLAQNRIKAGWTVDKTRKLVITLGCVIMLPSLLALSNPGAPVTAVLLMAVILFGFQTAIGNVQTLPSDFFGGKTVGSLAGFAGMAAKLGAVGLTSLIPWLTSDGNYTPAFIIGAALALIAMASIWVLCPKIEPLKPHY
ncbi:MAG: MFS transporter, partial [Bacteroidota bacterium]